MAMAKKQNQPAKKSQSIIMPPQDSFDSDDENPTQTQSTNQGSNNNLSPTSKGQEVQRATNSPGKRALQPAKSVPRN